MPIVGVVSDGQSSIALAVAQVLPEVAHGLCHFHYLREAAKGIYEADRHAKKELKKRVRGVRELERAVVDPDDPMTEVVQGYCQAVRSALTDDGRPPLDAAGIRLQQRLSVIEQSLDRVVKKGDCLSRSAKLQRILATALEQTAALWSPITTAYEWVYRAATIQG